MEPVNIHDAKTRFSRLVDSASAGETVVIAKAGRPVAKLVRFDAPDARPRLGFLAGTAAMPADFDTMGAEVVVELFDGPR